MVLSFIGACLLWVGWFGFNAGSALSAGPLATSAFINTHFAAAAAALGWTVAEWIHNGRPTALGAISGAVAGLVAITPASGFVQPFSALAIGLVAGIFCSFMVFEVKSRLRYDDSLDAFGVHGAGGTLAPSLPVYSQPAPSTPSSAKTRTATPSPPAQWTAIGASYSISLQVSASRGEFRLWAHWLCSSWWTK